MIYTRPLLAITCTVLLTAAAALPAAATPNADDLGASEQLRSQHRSLAASLADYHATQSGMQLGELLASSPETTRAAFDLPDLETGQLADVHERRDLDQMLADHSRNISAPDPSSFDEFRTQLAGDRSLDATVANLAARNTLERAQLHIPDLELPEVPDGMFNLSAPPEAVAIGQLQRNTMTTLIDDFPDVFADIDQRGTLDPANRDAFNTALSEGARRTSDGFSDLLPAPCLAGMLTATASGTRADAAAITGGDPNCGSCVTAGLYLHQDLNRVSNPSWNMLRSDDGSELTENSWASLDPRIREQNPAADPHRDGGALDHPTAPSTALRDCETSSQATQGATSTFAPDVADVFDRLFE